MSFAEWTATSIRPPSSASSSSLTNTPRAPISPNGFVRSLSPAVVIGTSAISTPCLRSRLAASSACVSASRLPRVPTRSSTSTLVVEPEEVPDRVGVDGPARAGRGLFHPHRRQVQELVDDLRRHRLDREPLALGQPSQARAGTLELRRADRLRPCTQRGDLRDDVPGGLPRPEARGLLSHDRLGPSRLPAAGFEALGDDGFEVVDVVEIAALELVDRRIEVAWDRDVDQEQRPTLTGGQDALDPVSSEDVSRRAR